MGSGSGTNPDVIREIQRVDPSIVERARSIQPALFTDVMGRRGAMNSRIRALSRSMKVAGPAVTVDVRPGDNLMIHAAMAIAKPGDVLVIDGKGDQGAALMGTIMLSVCRALGIAGVVMDAPCRDSDEIIEMGFPMFCAGTNPNGPTKFVPGRINWPATVGGVVVNPGDLIVADADGVVVVERDRAASLLAPATTKMADERKRLEAIARGEALRPPWLKSALLAAGVLKDGEEL